jgi:hypothetical protein
MSCLIQNMTNDKRGKMSLFKVKIVAKIGVLCLTGALTFS